MILIAFGFLLPELAFAFAVPSKTVLSPYSYLLSIPSIGVGAGVVAMGTTADGKMAVPNNFKDVGWYSLGTAPGQSGNAVLGAHVDNGGAIAGVFKHLKDLRKGTIIALKDSKGALLQYRVSKIALYDRNAKDTSSVFTGDGSSKLVLITCAGTWLPKQNTYSSRLVVFADLVKA